MSYPIRIYATADGRYHTASQTDQAGTACTTGRTVQGQPCEYAGSWYASQTPYRPFQSAVDAAASLVRVTARRRELAAQPNRWGCVWSVAQ